MACAPARGAAHQLPVLHRVLGDAAFGALADDYMHAHPSQKRSIRWFGDCLPDFVAGRIDALPHPALADLARMEWRICLAFDAADRVPLGFERLARTTPRIGRGFASGFSPVSP